MSIAEDLQRIIDARDAMIQAISDKGVAVPEGTKIDGLATLIAQIGGDTPTPTGLPANTLRFRFSDPNYNPDTDIAGPGKTEYITATWTKVNDSEYNDWDWTCNDTNWGAPDDESSFDAPFYGAFEGYRDLETHEYIYPMEVEIIAAGDTSSVTNLSYMFCNCTELKSICLFNTSNVTNVSGMFRYNYDAADGDTTMLLEELPLFDTSNVTNMEYFCAILGNLKSIPLFNTSKVTKIGWAFTGCINVESGALALYQQLSSQANPPSTHQWCFSDCGMNTTAGAAELAQIPSDWK